jgi:hypothetical protein
VFPDWNLILRARLPPLRWVNSLERKAEGGVAIAAAEETLEVEVRGAAEEVVGQEGWGSGPPVGSGPTADIPDASLQWQLNPKLNISMTMSSIWPHWPSLVH